MPKGLGRKFQIVVEGAGTKRLNEEKSVGYQGFKI